MASSSYNPFLNTKRQRNDDDDKYFETTSEHDSGMTGNKETDVASSSSIGDNSNGATLMETFSMSYQAYVLRENVEEQLHFDDVTDAYRMYATYAMLQWTNHSHRLSSLPESLHRFLPNSLKSNSDAYQRRKDQYQDAVWKNQLFLDCVLKHSGLPDSRNEEIASLKAKESTNDLKNVYSRSIEGKMSKVTSVLKSLARDWSVECSMERTTTYSRIIESVLKYIPICRVNTTTPSNICIPGAGVGRLMCEISALGYTVQGNEFSLYMLLASDFILNGPIQSIRPIQISPWILESRNVHSFSDQTRLLNIPDVDASEFVFRGKQKHITHSKEFPNKQASAIEPDFSMAAGDFVSIYNTSEHQCKWDCVIACFFLDTSPCIIEYLQVCYRMLRPGGYLVSFGPLLWHWSGPVMVESNIEMYRNANKHLDPRYIHSIDFCWDDVKEILVNIGFVILECSTNNPALYTADCKSMMNTHYNCIHFVAIKQ